MKRFPQYKIVAVEDTNWDQATSAKVAQQLLSKFASKGGIQGAYGMADNMAVGIIQGAKQAGVPIGVAKKGLVVTGSNCLSRRHQGDQGRAASTAPERRRRRSRPPSRSRSAAQILNGGTPPKVSYVKEAPHHQGERRQVHEGLHLLAGRPRLMSGERDPASFSRIPFLVRSDDSGPAGAPRGRRPLEVVRPGPRRSGPHARRSGRRGARDLRAQRRRQEHAGEGARRASSGPTRGSSASTARSSRSATRTTRRRTGSRS